MEVPRTRTLLEYCGENDSSNCGYCKGERATSEKCTLGLWAHMLSNFDYMELLDRGWRRSGKYLYKPINDKTCCPQYTIRLDVTRFQLSRSQKRVLRQMNEFLETGKKPRCSIREEDPIQKSRKIDVTEETSGVKISSNKVQRSNENGTAKKKEIRRKRFEEKCRARNIDIDEVKKNRIKKEESRRRTIDSYVSKVGNNWKYRLETKLVPVNSDEFQTRDNESFELFKKYQRSIHNDTDCRLASYRRFLCDSPLDEQKDGDLNFGSYHIWFLLDGKLIAVSVIDILTRCLSAKYMFYDPDYSFLSLGTYTALREIEQTKKLFEQNSSIRYYYMGYYIDTCPKMRYKAKFRPSDLLCDYSFQWVDFEKCKTMLEKSEEENGYTIFCKDSERPPSFNTSLMKVFSKGTIMSFSMFAEENPDILGNECFKEKIERLAYYVGSNIPNIVYYFNELN